MIGWTKPNRSSKCATLFACLSDSTIGDILNAQTFHLNYLLEDFKQRQSRNPRFSLRAYARLLEIHPSALSRIFNAKQEISTTACIKLISIINIEEPHLKQFVLSYVNEKRANTLAKFAKAFSIQFEDLAPVLALTQSNHVR